MFSLNGVMEDNKNHQLSNWLLSCQKNSTGNTRQHADMSGPGAGDMELQAPKSKMYAKGHIGGINTVDAGI